MSNLSDLMPAGASGKTIEATATATIASKAPVILNSAGTVTEVGETVTAESLGSTADIAGATVIGYGVSVTYNEAEDKLVAVYILNSDSDAYAVVGTISGTSTTWGTPVNASGAVTADKRPRVETIPGTSKVLFVWTTGSGGSSAVGTISGTSISFGTITNYVSGGPLPEDLSMAWDSVNDQMMVTYFSTYNAELFAMAATITGTSVSFTTQDSSRVLDASGGNIINTDLAYDTNAGAFVASYRNSSNLGYCIVFTSDGTNITKGTATQLPVYSNTNGVGGVTYDSTAQKVVFGMKDDSAAGYGIVGTVSGTSISFGTEVVFYSGALSTTDTSMAVVYAGSAANTTTMIYSPTSDSYTYYVNGTVSGTDISFNTPARAYTDSAQSLRNAMCVVSSGKVAMLFNPQSTSGGMTDNYVYAAILQNTASITNLTATNFVGIADAGIATSATGTIVVQGGTVGMVADTTYTVTVGGGKFLIDGVSQATLNLYEGSTYKFDQAAGTNSTHPLRFSASSDGTHGTITPVAFDTSASTVWPQATFDSTNNKIVIGYNISGTGAFAIVGTVSGNSITYGTAVAISGAGNSYGSITYDSNANRVVLSYRDYNNSDYGTSVVGTVSGTSISFGTPVVFASANVPGTSSTFDSSNNKVVIVYKDGSDGNKGKGIVGTVSGTSISFGTAVEFSSQCDKVNCTFDSSNNKVVVQYRNEASSAHGTANVGTVSGTSISFGADVVFNASGTSMIGSSFDTTANKVVLSYQDGGNSDYGTGIVGTVSGTSISFGAEGVFESAATAETFCAYDASADRTTIIYQDSANSNYGTSVNGTISGTGISFDTPAVYSSATTTYNSCVYDSNAEKVVFSYFNSTSGFSYVYPISEYTTGVTTNGTPGSAGAYTQIAVASGAPTLYYYCSNHSGMGGTANTPSFVTGSKYYVQNDGTITTVSSSVNAGLATSTTQLLLNGDS